MSDTPASDAETLRKYAGTQEALHEALVGFSAADQAVLGAIFSVLTDEQKSLVQERARLIAEQYELSTTVNERMLKRLSTLID
ncbi:hypothetical protein JRX38_02450 [Gluconobacter cerinus]|uniref:hypothetical protein n=1 Tax=Gluconobacter cerinus TaxID=38307 RepID=UPI00193F5644|nr:hypothetical protein [Gluconobacter cerinus]MBM3096891.1 hypothetical protein [Gluconobacter cerinus]